MIEHKAIGRQLRTCLDLHELAIYTNGLFVSPVCDLCLTNITTHDASVHVLEVIVIDQFPRFICSIEARIPRAKPKG